MSNKANEFIEWVDAQEAALEITDYELSKKGGFSHSVLSRARSGIPPQWDICMKISSVFNVSPITVFRKAGLLPQGPDDEINLEDWQYLLIKMTSEERDELLQIGTMKIDRRQKAEQAARTSNLKPKKAGK
jgi:hypothetical protein